MSQARTLALIEDLRQCPAETPWLEFKHNNASAPMIGKLISALSNSARLHDQHHAYVVWGIRDNDHATIGTTFEPSRCMEKQQPLEMWLAQHLSPDIAFQFETIDYRGTRLVLLDIPAASSSPIEFDRTAYIRIGSATPRLADYPDRMRMLWSKLQPYVWEQGQAATFQTSDDVLEKLDYASYFQLTQQPLPDNRAGILERLQTDQLITTDVGGHWNITHLGAVLFARRMDDFPVPIARKAIRFVAYGGPNRASQVTHRRDGQKGYACGFEGLIDYLDGLLPANEFIGKAFREEASLYPAIALRELIANALIHQDMTVTGAGPQIELFNDRIEITNPGQPLIDPARFLDSPPRSRNEALAALMRRMRLCEEQGTGIDKVLVAVEVHQLPAPDFRAEAQAMRVVLFAPRAFVDMSPEERIRACYQHSGLKYVSGQQMKNATLRERLGIDQKNAAQASVIIRQTLDAELIKPADPKHPKAGYVPFWA